MADNMEAIQQALSHAYALHAIILGKRADRDEVSADVDAQLGKAETAFNKASSEARKRLDVALVVAKNKLDQAKEGQTGRVQEANTAVLVAEQELAQHQGKAREDLGVVIDLSEAKPTGGRTAL